MEAIPPGLIEWFEEGAALLEETLRAADPDEPVWSWSGDNRVAHYLRMMPIETAVHRWDAQLAHDQTEPIDRALAEDGIAHTFEVMAPFRRQQAQAALGEGDTFVFRQTDGYGEWVARFAGPRIWTGRIWEEPDVVVRGSASDLFLFLWHRIPHDQLDAEGHIYLLNRLFELIPPLWRR